MKVSKNKNRKWLEFLDGFEKARVLVVGDVMHDVFIWGAVKRISPEAPVPVVEVNKETSLLGGAANVANNVRALGAKAMIAGVVGRDPHGVAVIKALDAIGADRACLKRSQTRPTAVKTRIIAHHQQVVRFDREEVRGLKDSTFKSLWNSIKKNIDKVDAVIVSDYKKGLVSADLMERLTPLCQEKGKIIAVDPKPAHADFYKGVTVLTPNNREASEMAGFEIETDRDLGRAGEAIMERLEPKALLITRGEKGMALFRQGEKPVTIPVMAREVYDVTGAGDTVIGTLTVAMVAGMDMVEAVKVANLAAAIGVGKLGTSVVTVDELKAHINGGRKK